MFDEKVSLYRFLPPKFSLPLNSKKIIPCVVIYIIYIRLQTNRVTCKNVHIRVYVDCNARSIFIPLFSLRYRTSSFPEVDHNVDIKVCIVNERYVHFGRAFFINVSIITRRTTHNETENITTTVLSTMKFIRLYRP